MKNDTKSGFLEKNANELRLVTTVVGGYYFVDRRKDKPDLTKLQAQKNRP
jgi:hypothetical protein